MPAQTRWMAFRLAIVAVTVLGIASAWATAASAYDSVGMASTPTTVDLGAAQDVLAAPAAGDSGTRALGVMLDTDDGWDMGSGWWIIMPIMMVLFWGGIIGVAVWGIRQFTRDRRRDRSALDIAKERLARGEITKEEFDRIRGDLS
ncbi:hypothetical protein LCGC14_2524390 [marine sediment metagenome]|uniref:SHOCT domain-containing protein n=1 Tax=marine sediment metagenome TaxID=412755 RepID=A0A0F9AVF7_9ZZZZ